MITDSEIFTLKGRKQFIKTALQVFRYQYQNNIVYHNFCNYLKRTPQHVCLLEQIPFLPITLFKSTTITTGTFVPQAVFKSSGTTTNELSSHFVKDLDLYRQSFRQTFQSFYGNVADYTILALLPSYLERSNSSLVFMVNDLISHSKNPNSRFYLTNLEELRAKLHELDNQEKTVLLIGVTYALLDLVEDCSFNLKNTIIMETGGMKGKRKEMIREELHRYLCEKFGVTTIHSEYGMTELLSQAYSFGNGIFHCPPWMQVIARDPEDALSILDHQKTGGLNIIDLANIHSCSFIATQDLGKVYDDGSFEVIGRYDYSDVRGCNLMVV